jgi:hypothetical protein
VWDQATVVQAASWCFLLERVSLHQAVQVDAFPFYLVSDDLAAERYLLLVEKSQIKTVVH